MNIIYLGTPDFAVPTLASIYNKGYNISLVITQRDKKKGRGKKLQYTPVKEKALILGLEVFQPDNINDEEVIEKIRTLKPDFIIVAAYGQILKKELLTIPKYGCLNVHASLLPRYRGAAPINWAIINGEKQTGISIMRMEEGLDTGDTILIKSIPIKDEDDFVSIHDKLKELGADMIIHAINDILKGQAIFTAQDHTNSNYAPMIFKDTGKIDWNINGEKIYNLVRGLKPWPNAYTIYKGDIVKIHKVKFIKDKVISDLGKIIKISKEGIYVSVKDGYIIIEELQFPGKKILTVSQYLAGNHIEEGIVLN